MSSALLFKKRSFLLAATLWFGAALPAYATIVYNNGDVKSDPISSSETLQVNGADAAEQSGAISGSGTAIEKTGTGALTLSSANTHDGGTALSAGTLDVEHNNALGTGGLSLADGTTLALGSFINIGNGLTTVGSPAISVATSTSATISGNIADGISAGGLVKEGGGALILSGSGNSYTGETVVNAGVLRGGVANAFGADSAMTINASGTLDLGGFDQAVGSLEGSGYINNASGSGLNRLTVDGGNYNSTTFSGSIDDGFGAQLALNKTGVTTLTLTGSNSYSGGTTLGGGRISISSSAGIGSGDLTFNGGILEVSADANITNNATLQAGGGILANASNSNVIFSGDITGTGTLIKQGAGTITLTGTNSYSGLTTVRGGSFLRNSVLAFDNESRLGSGSVRLESGILKTTASMTFTKDIDLKVGIGSSTANGEINTNGYDSTFSGTISGAKLFKSGAGTLTLSGTNTNTALEVDAGTVAFSSAANLGSSSGTVTLKDGTLKSTADATLTQAFVIGGGFAAYAGTVDTNSHDVTIAGDMQSISSGYLVKSGAGTLTLSGSNGLLTGGIHVNAGTLSVGSTDNLGSGTVTLDGGRLLATGSTTTQAIALGAGGGTLLTDNSSYLTVDGVISGGGALVIDGGTAPAGVFVTQDNTYTGGTTITNGTLIIGHGGTAGSILGNVVNNHGLSFYRSDDIVFSGIISGTGSVQHDGAGKLTLSGNNSYSGITLLKGGDLGLENSHAAGTGTIHNNTDGATISYADGITIANAINMHTDLTKLEVGTGNAATQAGVVSGGTGGILEKTGAGTLILTGTNTYTGGTKISAGTLAINDDANLGSGDVTFTGGTLRTDADMTIGHDIAMGTGSGTLNTNGHDVDYAGIITGSTGIAKTGSGTLTFSDNNNYSGQTSVSAGTLRAGKTNAFAYWSSIDVAGGATLDVNGYENNFIGLTGDGTLTNNGSADAVAWVGGNSSNDFVFDGAITDGSSHKLELAYWGGGSMTLTNASNTYSGGTYVQYGTLRLGVDNAISQTSGLNLLGGYTGTLDMNGYDQTVTGLYGGGVIKNEGSADSTFTLDGSGDYTFGGTLRDGTTHKLALVKDGAGTLVLTGNSTYSGGTILEGGTLSVANGNSLGHGFIRFVAGGLTVTGSTTLSQNIELAGAGYNSLLLNGDRLTLAGVISGDAVFDIFGGVSTPQTITLDGDNNAFTGGFSLIGTRTAPQTYATTLVLNAADNLGSGNLDLRDANLRAAADMTVANSLSLSNNGGAIDSGGYHLVLDGVVSGAELTKIGDGVLTLNAANSYSGGTVVKAGTLQIGDAAHENASILNDVTVDAGAVVSGHGHIGGTLANAHGTVAPGGSVGTLSVAGNYTQGADGSLSIAVAPAATSVLSVTGTAALAGTLQLHFEGGDFTRAARYRFLQAGAVTGNFSSIVAAAPAGFSLSALTYSPTEVSFALNVLAPANATGVSVSTSTQMNAAQRAADTLFGHLASNGAGLQTAETETTFNALSEVGLVKQENIQAVNNIVKAMPSLVKAYGGWFKTYGNLGSVASDETAPGYDNQSAGFMLGADGKLADALTVGVAGGYENTTFSEHTATQSDGTANTVRFALYAREALGVYALDAQLGYAHHMIETERFVAGNSLIAAASHGGDEYSSGLQLSRVFAMAGLRLTPRAGVNYVHLSEEGYDETGAGIFNMTVDEKGTDSLRLFTGMKASQTFNVREDFPVTPEARIGYSYEALNNNRNAAVSVAGAGFVVEGLRPSRHTLSLGTGLTTRLDDRLDAFGNYDVNLRTGNSFDQTFSAGLKLKF